MKATFGHVRGRKKNVDLTIIFSANKEEGRFKVDSPKPELFVVFIGPRCPCPQMVPLSLTSLILPISHSLFSVSTISAVQSCFQHLSRSISVKKTVTTVGR